MDIKRRQDQPSLLRKLWYVPIVLALAVLAFQYYSYLSEAEFSINFDKLRIAEVTRQDFTIEVQGAGTLVPREVRWIASEVEGRIERLFAKPGKYVEQGEIIMQLANIGLMQALDESRWELEAFEADLQVRHANMESSQLDQQMVVLEAELRYESGKLKFDAESELFQDNKGAISELDYKRSKLETEQLKQSWYLQQERGKALIKNQLAQNNANAARYAKMQKMVERIARQVEGLTIRASIAGVIQEVPVAAGQLAIAGSNLARIAPQDDLIAVVEIAEVQIAGVSIGQRAIIDTRNNTITGLVARIDPAVLGGVVLVDIELESPLPGDARPDLSIDGTIFLADIKDTLTLMRPMYVQSQSLSSIYRITTDGRFAERIPVRFGHGSVNKIQVVSGLTVGDQIILSDSSEWEAFAKVRLN